MTGFPRLSFLLKSPAGGRLARAYPTWPRARAAGSADFRAPAQ